MEQFEDGHDDHNVLATLVGETATVDAAIQATLSAFSHNVFGHIEGKRMIIGRFLGPGETEAHIAAHRDDPTGSGLAGT